MNDTRHTIKKTLHITERLKRQPWHSFWVKFVLVLCLNQKQVASKKEPNEEPKTSKIVTFLRLVLAQKARSHFVKLKFLNYLGK